jgi:hypothetical protein
METPSASALTGINGRLLQPAQRQLQKGSSGLRRSGSLRKPQALAGLLMAIC